MSTKPTKAAPRKVPAKPSLIRDLEKVLPAGMVPSMQPNGRLLVALDPTLSPDQFRSLAGSEIGMANMHLLGEVLSVMPPSEDARTVGGRVAGILALLKDLKPADGVEGMIAVQTVALHVMAMEAARRSMLGGPEAGSADKLRKSSANLMRAQVDMLAALDRKRGKINHQTVRVERVLVTEGGSLIASGSPVPALGQCAAPMALATAEAGEGEGVGHVGSDG